MQSKIVTTIEEAGDFIQAQLETIMTKEADQPSFSDVYKNTGSTIYKFNQWLGANTPYVQFTVTRSNAISTINAKVAIRKVNGVLQEINSNWFAMSIQSGVRVNLVFSKARFGFLLFSIFDTQLSQLSISYYLSYDYEISLDNMVYISGAMSNSSVITVTTFDSQSIFYRQSYTEYFSNSEKWQNVLVLNSTTEPNTKLFNLNPQYLNIFNITNTLNVSEPLIMYNNNTEVIVGIIGNIMSMYGLNYNLLNKYTFGDTTYVVCNNTPCYIAEDL